MGRARLVRCGPVRLLANDLRLFDFAHEQQLEQRRLEFGADRQRLKNVARIHHRHLYLAWFPLVLVNFQRTVRQVAARVMNVVPVAGRSEARAVDEPRRASSSSGRASNKRDCERARGEGTS